MGRQDGSIAVSTRSINRPMKLCCRSNERKRNSRLDKRGKSTLENGRISVEVRRVIGAGTYNGKAPMLQRPEESRGGGSGRRQDPEGLGAKARVYRRPSGASERESVVFLVVDREKERVSRGAQCVPTVWRRLVFFPDRVFGRCFVTSNGRARGRGKERNESKLKRRRR